MTAMALRGSVWSFGLNKRLWTFPTLLTGEMSHEINKMRNKINEHYFAINSFILQALMFYLVVTLGEIRWRSLLLIQLNFSLFLAKILQKHLKGNSFIIPSLLEKQAYRPTPPLIFFLNCQPELSLISLSIALNIRNPKQENGRIFCGARTREQGRVYIIQWQFTQCKQNTTDLHSPRKRN